MTDPLRNVGGNLFHFLRSVAFEGAELLKIPVRGQSETATVALNSGLIEEISVNGMTVRCLTELGWKTFRLWEAERK